MRLRVRVMLFSAAVALCPLPAGAQTVATHDNLKSAGTLRDGVLSISLWAGMGQWAPSGPGTTAVPIAAFGEEGQPLSIPSPLIRAPEGTTVHITIRNTLAQPLIVRGLCDRPGQCGLLHIPAGSSGAARFTLAAAGTFHYWASTGATAIDLREGDDSQLGGAIVVDPAGEAARDRVFVMGLKDDPAHPDHPLTVINGRSWPHTERLSHATGDSVRWRVLNVTAVAHAMHLHGFYFQVESTGNGIDDRAFGAESRRSVVTEQLPPGGTMTMSWVPERAGNWLFHCHMLVHMTPPGPAASHADHGAAGGAGMAGLVLGITVTGPDSPRPAPPAPARKVEMTIDPDTRLGTVPSFTVGLTSRGAAFPRIGGAAPGPVMVLTRGEPVEVEIMNRLREPTAIHWHGIELESFDDGVPGFGGTAGSVTPPVEAGGRFTARFTPSRAGTFIYHTHWHNPAQLAGGIYGPIVVLEPGETWDPQHDRILMLSLEGAYTSGPRGEAFAVNGERAPRPLELQAGVTHRLRIINITGNNVALTLQLVSRFDPVQWTPLGKDGAVTPPAQRKPRASRQLVAVGETYDFELAPMAATPAGLWLELRRGNGELLLQWPVRVR